MAFFWANILKYIIHSNQVYHVSRSVVYDQDSLYRVIDGQWGGIFCIHF